MTNLLDLMTEGDRRFVLSMRNRRLDSSTNRRKISPRLYLAAELGYYYGWQAVETIKRGYTQKLDPRTGEEKTILFTDEELEGFIEAGRKIWAKHNLDLAHTVQVAVASALSKNPQKVMKEGMANVKRESQL